MLRPTPQALRQCRRGLQGLGLLSHGLPLRLGLLHDRLREDRLREVRLREVRLEDGLEVGLEVIVIDVTVIDVVVIERHGVLDDIVGLTPLWTTQRALGPAPPNVTA
jgi:hypothetical protein